MSNVYLRFRGKSQVGSHTASFNVMVGDNPPLMKSGYAKYVTVDRPLQRGLTVFTGYDPMTLDVEVRFGVRDHQPWNQDDATARFIERDINSLEWMGGVNFHGGPPPLVFLSAHNSQGHDTNLIPAPAGNGRPWTIADIQWGVSYRNPAGDRVWQDATVTLQSFIGIRPFHWGSSPGGKAGAFIHASPPNNTPLQIANRQGSPAESAQTLARRIMAHPKNNPMRGSNIALAGKSLSSPIPTGTAVWVPYDQGSFDPGNDLTQINPLTSLV